MAGIARRRRRFPPHPFAAAVVVGLIGSSSRTSFTSQTKRRASNAAGTSACFKKQCAKAKIDASKSVSGSDNKLPNGIPCVVHLQEVAEYFDRELLSVDAGELLATR